MQCTCIAILMETPQMYHYKGTLSTPYSTEFMRWNPPILRTKESIHYCFVLLPLARKYKNILQYRYLCKALCCLSYDFTRFVYL